MSDEIENELVIQVQPIFPQLSEEVIRIMVSYVRRRVQPAEGGPPLTAPLLLPLCIDHLLEATQIVTVPLGYNGQRTVPLENGINQPELVVLTERQTNNGATDHIIIGSHALDKRDVNPDLVVPNTKTGVETSITNGKEQNNATYVGIETQVRDSVLREPSIISSSASCSPSSSSSSRSNSRSSSDCYVTNDERFEEDEGRSKKFDFQVNSQTDVFETALKMVVGVVVDVEESYALNYLRCFGIRNNFDPAKMANELIEYLFENKNYPKKVQAVANVIEVKQKIEEPKPDIDYFKVEQLTGHHRDQNLYKSQSLVLLANHFNLMPYKHIKDEFRKNFHRYARTYKVLQDMLEVPKEFQATYLLRYRRPKQYIPTVLHFELEKECRFLEEKEKKRKEDSDHVLAQLLNDEQYKKEGQYIECNCCYGEAVFEDMLQCSEGHLSCQDCVRNYAKESIYGSGKIPLSCLTAECTSIFPLSQLNSALDSGTIEKYQERLMEESLKMAELPDLVRCPFCDFAAEMPPGDKVFKCQKTECMKETCRFCKEPWKEHIGIPCTEMESGKEKNIRVSYEEQMSRAKIRTCSMCGCGFMKTDGCNKMTCRCGAKMCYLCRTPKIDYNHFCNHPRNPGKPCNTCTKCSLWTDPTEDEERAVRELQEEAAKEVAKVKSPAVNGEEVASAGSKRPLVVGPPDEYVRRKKHKRRR